MNLPILINQYVSEKKWNLMPVVSPDRKATIWIARYGLPGWKTVFSCDETHAWAGNRKRRPVEISDPKLFPKIDEWVKRAKLEERA